MAGYNLYRRGAGDGYSNAPIAQVGPVSDYFDTGLTGGQVYSYSLRSYDPAGNLHQLSDEVGAVPLTVSEVIYFPIILK